MQDIRHKPEPDSSNCTAKTRYSAICICKIVYIQQPAKQTNQAGITIATVDSREGRSGLFRRASLFGCLMASLSRKDAIFPGIHVRSWIHSRNTPRGQRRRTGKYYWRFIKLFLHFLTSIVPRYSISYWPMYSPHQRPTSTIGGHEQEP